MRTMNVTRSRSTVVSQARANGRFLVLQLDNNDANPTMRSCRKARGGAFVVSGAHLKRPLWLMSGHWSADQECPLHPQERTCSASSMGCPQSAKSRPAGSDIQVTPMHSFLTLGTSYS